MTVTKKTLKFAAFFVIFFLGAVFSVVAQDTGGVKGKIRNLNGYGIAGATVAARQNGLDLKTASADSKGSFVLDGLNPGIYNLAFEARGYTAAVQYNVEIKKGKVRDLGDRLILEVDRGSRVIVKGSVFYKDGTSARFAKVEIFRVNSDGSEKKILETNADDMGDFGFNQPEGLNKFRLKATLGEGKGSADLSVESAMVYRLAIKLDIDRTQIN